jgi:hypothetical protein
MVNLTEKIKDALTDTKESDLGTEEIGELCMGQSGLSFKENGVAASFFTND